MYSDPIADMLTRLRNSYLANRKMVKIPYSQIKEKILKILVQEGYLKNCISKKETVGLKSIKMLNCKLKYINSQPVITQIKRVSRPSLRKYSTKKNLPKVLGGLGIVVVSTSKGIMTGKQAKKMGIGGEIICQIF
jgi:small subunit ribosomal protein S8